MDANSDETAGPSDANRTWVTIPELLKEQDELQAESDAVLGGSDDKNCTYSKGYISRQALYSCLTCMPECRTNEDKRAGICLACSYECHEGHELIELYTKRNFRCDCGGKRMRHIRCKLDPLKLDANDLNMYNQNFSGLYCTCKRPYPDPEDTVPDEMVQCTICEDWFHTRHLDSSGERKEADGLGEMVCEGCMQKVYFLRNYVGKINDGNETDVNDTTVDESNVAETSAAANDKSAAKDNGAIEEKNDKDNAKRAKVDICTKPPLEEGAETSYKEGATFWADDWRNQLCRCSDCMAVYKELKVEFLLDHKDTVEWYQENGRVRLQNEATEQYLKSWNRMGRVQQVEFLTGVNHMKDRLCEFLDTFVASQEVITERAVREFFAKLNKEREDGNNGIGVPSHFCR